MLVEIGVLHALTVGERTKYGLTHQPHHHAVCTSCGTVIEVPEEQLKIALDRQPRKPIRTLADPPA